MAAFTTFSVGISQRLFFRTCSTIIRPTTTCLSSTSKALEIPPPPKRPPSAYVKFFVVQRPKVLQENQGLKSIAIVKKVGELWHLLTDEEKQKYQTDTNAEMAKYIKIFEKYKAGLTADQLKTLVEIRREKRRNLKKRKYKQLLSKLDKPCRPVTSFICFMQSKMKEKGNQKATVFLKTIICTEWKSLSEEEKQPYKTLADADVIRYQKDMKVWEEKMMLEGRPELIRGFQRAKKKPIKKIEKSKRTKTVSSKATKSKLKPTKTKKKTLKKTRAKSEE